MNYIRIQNELLKSAEKRDGWKKAKFEYKYSETDEVVMVTEGHIVWFIPKECFYLDVNKVFNQIPFNGEMFMKEYDHEAKMTTECVAVDKKILRKFICNNEDVWIDESFLKDFDLKSGCPSFRGSSRKAPIQIYEGGVLVGLVLPVNYSKKDGD